MKITQATKEDGVKLVLLQNYLLATGKLLDALAQGGISIHGNVVEARTELVAWTKEMSEQVAKLLAKAESKASPKMAKKPARRK